MTQIRLWICLLYTSSQMSDRFIKHPLEVVSVGDIVDTDHFQRMFDKTVTQDVYKRQRLHHTYYRGCWHVFSWCYLVRYRHFFFPADRALHLSLIHISLPNHSKIFLIIYLNNFSIDSQPTIVTRNLYSHIDSSHHILKSVSYTHLDVYKRQLRHR